MTIKAKISSLLFIITFCSIRSFGQDIIYLVDGSKIEAEILEVQTYHIRYLHYSKSDSPVYLIYKSQVSKIVNENGGTTLFTEADKEDEKSNMNLNTNIMWYHMIDILYHDFTFSFEKIIKDGNMSLQIHLAIGFGPTNVYSLAYNQINSGIGLNIYPTGQGKARYFFGQSICIGHGKGYYDYMSWLDIYKLREVTYAKLFINNGFIFNPFNNYSISAVFSVGVKYIDRELSWYQLGFSRSAWFSIRTGYRF